MTAKTQKREPDFGEAFVAGGFAGLVSTGITNPFDTLRVRLSASRDATGVGSKTLRGHLRDLFSDGLFRGLGVGLRINLISSVPSNAVYLSSYRVIRRKVSEAVGDRPIAVPMLSASGAVMVTNAVLSPFFTTRTRVQLDKTATIKGVVSDIWRREGARGFYRGAITNTTGRIAEEATFWLLYETATRMNNSREGGSAVGADSSLTSGSAGFLWRSFCIFGMASTTKIIASAITYPYNVVMTHLREVDKATGTHKHNHVLPTVKYIYANDGVRGFWKGITPHLIRSGLSKSTQVYFFEFGLCIYAHMLAMSGQPKY
jgi:solute carrier family 25 protein 33/36